MTEELMKERVEELVDYIMKKCLWQFHSRVWDRERQNQNILWMTARLVCGEEVNPVTPEERCYWVDAVCMADAFKNRFDWLNKLNATEKTIVMEKLFDRINFLTVTGSLNLELTEEHY